MIRDRSRDRSENFLPTLPSNNSPSVPLNFISGIYPRVRTSVTRPLMMGIFPYDDNECHYHENQSHYHDAIHRINSRATYRSYDKTFRRIYYKLGGRYDECMKPKGTYNYEEAKKIHGFLLTRFSDAEEFVGDVWQSKNNRVILDVTKKFYDGTESTTYLSLDDVLHRMFVPQKVTVDPLDVFWNRIRRLEIFIDVTYQLNIPNEIECPISLENIPKEEARRLQCGHTFGRKEIERWLEDNVNSSCPLCRQNVRQYRRSAV